MEPISWNVLCGPQSRIDSFESENSGDEVLVPRMTERRRVARTTRRVETVVVPMYHGYMFARGDALEEAKREEHQLRTLVWSGSPALVPDEQLEYAREHQWRTAMNWMPSRDREEVKVGDTVELLDGVLAYERAKVVGVRRDTATVIVLPSLKVAENTIPLVIDRSRISVLSR